MRYVNLHGLRLPTGWNARAKAAAKAVAKGRNPDKLAKVWRELKDHLAALLPEKKCWYCESPVDRADNAVDHFRPKNRVYEARKKHTGYRWLAFDHLNYRYSCTFCNSLRKDIDDKTSGGKADRFPLLNEAKRVYTPGPVDKEKPTLLDPCDWRDWELLGCKRENGEPCATSSDRIGRRRAETSIRIYHLDYEPTCKGRHTVAVQMLADVEEAKRLWLQITKGKAKEQEFKVVAGRVKRAINRDAAFSGEMIFLLRGQRHAQHPWIQTLLEA